MFSIDHPDIPAKLPSPEGFDSGGWYKGDWHLHSRHSTDSSNNPLSKIIGFAEKHGLDYLAITDHDVHVSGAVASHTWADPDFRSETVMLFYGAELTAPRGHINILCADPYDHQQVFNARNARDWDLLALKKELGVHMSANHPMIRNHYGYSFDLADSIEIWNTSGWEGNEKNVRVWDDMLLSGRMIGARGGSDSHHGVPDRPELATDRTFEVTGNYVGTPTTWIYAKERSKEALLAALVKGRASVSANPRNPRVELFADLTGDGSMDLMMGDNAKPTGEAVKFEVRLEGEVMENVAYQVRVVKNRSEFLRLETDPVTQIAHFSDVPGLEERSYYRVEIDGPQTPFADVPHCMMRSGSKVALSNPIYFNYNPDF